MNKTRRLFDEDARLLDFEAEVLLCRESGEGWEIVLDQTAFFPEGGGQGGDRGTLDGVRVLDTQERDGLILHQTDAPLPEGIQVHGQVDAERRMDQTQQHSGEHILSGLICATFGCRNVGFHIGAEDVTVDFSRPLSDEELQQVEDAANACVWRNVPVRVWVPDPEELRQLAYRSKKELTGDVRIVSIPGADTCACCGTHVRSTGEVGLIKILSAIHYKGGMRLTIRCGARALRWVRQMHGEVRAVSHALSAKPHEIASAVSRLLQERDQLAYQLGAQAQKLFAVQAEAEAGRPVRLVAAGGLPAPQLRKAAAQLAEGARLALVLIPRAEGGWSFALSGSGDVRPAARQLCERFGGKGGGAPDMVQGMLLDGTPETIRAALEACAL